MPSGNADLQTEEIVYLIRRGKRIFAVRAAAIEPAELHDDGLRAEALDALRKARSSVIVRRVVDSDPASAAKAQKTFVSED